MGITVDYTKVKKSPGIESRNKRKGPIKCVVRSHTVWSSEKVPFDFPDLTTLLQISHKGSPNGAVRYVHTHDVFLF